MPTKCDPSTIRSFDYGGLDPAFSKLSKPAQRALLNAKIRTPQDLAKRTLVEVQAFHGLGPSALPVLKAALQQAKLRFKKR